MNNVYALFSSEGTVTIWPASVKRAFGGSLRRSFFHFQCQGKKLLLADRYGRKHQSLNPRKGKSSCFSQALFSIVNLQYHQESKKLIFKEAEGWQ
jgi:hypothetical protein